MQKTLSHCKLGGLKRILQLVFAVMVIGCVLLVFLHPAIDSLDAAHHRNPVRAVLFAALFVASLLLPQAIVYRLRSLPVLVFFTGTEKLDLLCTRIC